MTENRYTSPNFNTKMKIFMALNELCSESQFDQISIMQICEHSGISRSTFYHHFHDKNAILQWHSFLAYEMGIDEIGRTLTWFEGHFVTTSILEDYLTLYFMAGYSREYSGVRPSFVRERVRVLSETVTDYKQAELTPELLFQIHATAALESSMAYMRYSGENKMAPAEYCKLLVDAIPRQIYELLEEPANPSEKSNAIMLFGQFL